MTAVAPGRNPRFFSASEWISEMVFALTCHRKSSVQKRSVFKQTSNEVYVALPSST